MRPRRLSAPWSPRRRSPPESQPARSCMGQPQPSPPGLVRRWLFPPLPSGNWTGWVPPEGRCWLLSAALLLLVSVVKNTNPLLLLTYLLLVTAVLNAWAAGRRFRALRLRRRVRGPGFARAPCVGAGRLGNPRPRPLRGGTTAHA